MVHSCLIMLWALDELMGKVLNRTGQHLMKLPHQSLWWAQVGGGTHSMMFVTLQTSRKPYHCVSKQDYLKPISCLRQVTASTLLQKLLQVILEAIFHHQAFTVFTKSLQAEHSEQLLNWEEQIQGWEADHTLLCPYEIPKESMSTMLVCHTLIFIANSLINDRGFTCWSKVPIDLAGAWACWEERHHDRSQWCKSWNICYHCSWVAESPVSCDMILGEA